MESIQVMGSETADVIAGATLAGEPLSLQDGFVTEMNGGPVAHPQLWSVARVLIGAETPPAVLTRLEVELRFVGKRHKRGWGYGMKVVAHQSPNRLGLINLNGTIVAPRPNRPSRPGR